MPKLNTFKGLYTPLNPHKYIGQERPFYRSSWEFSFMRYLDTHDKIIYWASESIKIPYKNPITGKNTIYIPDFFLICDTKKGRKSFLVEIKPKSQTSIKESKSNYDKLNAVVNEYKWRAAQIWCKSKGMEFIILTEKELFSLT